MGKKLLFMVLVVFTLGSCNVYRTINFNADQSGTMENKVDMSSMIALMGENSATSNPMGTMGDQSELDRTKADLESISGISGVQVSYDTTGIITTSYNFNSVEALNKALGSGYSQSTMLGMGQETTGNLATIKYKGKKFTWTEINKNMLKKLQSDESKSEMVEMDMMLASSKLITTITFPFPIKKISYKNASVINDKTIHFEMSVKECLSEKYKPLVVNLK